MNVMCINTAFSQTYVVVKSNNLIVEQTMDSSLKQSENVLNVVDYCLTNANLKIEDLNFISCVVGPGSFTGIRIGASLCKGFCMACQQVKKVQVCSLDLIAHTFVKQNNPTTAFYVALNGLSGNVFACKFNKYGERECEPYLASGDQIEQINGIVVGLKEEMFDICNNFVEFSTKELLDYSLEKIQKQELSADFVPTYLRKSQAEAELDKKNGNC